MDEVVLISESNRPVGLCGKMEAHQKGLLHRAFSIFLIGSGGHLLIQRRALAKYHSAGLWANSCCGHAAPGERTIATAKRRLGEELGLDAFLTPLTTCRYQCAVDQGMVENELAYIFVGRVSGTPRPDPAEVAELRYLDVDELIGECAASPQRYAGWLTVYLDAFAELLRAATSQ